MSEEENYTQNECSLAIVWWLRDVKSIDCPRPLYWFNGDWAIALLSALNYTQNERERKLHSKLVKRVHIIVVYHFWLGTKSDSPKTMFKISLIFL